MRIPLAVLTALVLLLPVSAPAAVGGEGDADDIELEEATAWFVCDGTTPDAFVNHRLDDPTPTWADEEPSVSAMDGEGCGSANPSLVNGTEQESPYDQSFAGTFTGLLDTITVRLHNAYLGSHRDGNPLQNVDVRLTVDGISAFGIEQRTGTDVDGGTFETVTHWQPAIRRMQVRPDPDGADGFAPVYKLSITGLDYLLEDEDDVEHRVVLTVSTPFSAGNAQNLWLWGATEVPSSITFNAEVPDPAFFMEAIPRDEREDHEDYEPH